MIILIHSWINFQQYRNIWRNIWMTFLEAFYLYWILLEIILIYELISYVLSICLCFFACFVSSFYYFPPFAWSLLQSALMVPLACYVSMTVTVTMPVTSVTSRPGSAVRDVLLAGPDMTAKQVRHSYCSRGGWGLGGGFPMLNLWFNIYMWYWCISSIHKASIRACNTGISVVLMYSKYAHITCRYMSICSTYRKTSNIRHTPVGNTIVDHSDVVGASPVGAAPTTSSFLT